SCSSSSSLNDELVFDLVARDPDVRPRRDLHRPRDQRRQNDPEGHAPPHPDRGQHNPWWVPLAMAAWAVHGAGQRAVQPPSINSVVPVIIADAGEQRKTTDAAT